MDNQQPSLDDLYIYMCSSGCCSQTKIAVGGCSLYICSMQYLNEEKRAAA
jgi:hypothetical protein